MAISRSKEATALRKKIERNYMLKNQAKKQRVKKVVNFIKYDLNPIRWDWERILLIIALLIFIMFTLVGVVTVAEKIADVFTSKPQPRVVYEEPEPLTVPTKKEIIEQEKKATEAQIQHDNQVKNFMQTYKAGDRIKIYDYVASPVLENGKYRLSIGAVDTIDYCDYENLKIYGTSGNVWMYDMGVDKVRSNREYRDLVDMELKGKLYFERE